MQIIKKLDRLETHDRLEYLVNDESNNVFQGVEDCLKKNPICLVFQDYCPYIYIFAHARTSDDGSAQRVLWQPRLTRPKPESNSFLFRAKSKTDLIEVCWIVPKIEFWSEFEEGKIHENEIVRWSIDMFVNHRDKLSQNHPEDLSDGEIKHIYMQVDTHFKQKKLGKKLILPEWFV